MFSHVGRWQSIPSPPHPSIDGVLLRPSVRRVSLFVRWTLINCSPKPSFIAELLICQWSENLHLIWSSICAEASRTSCIICACTRCRVGPAVMVYTQVNKRPQSKLQWPGKHVQPTVTERLLNRFDKTEWIIYVERDGSPNVSHQSLYFRRWTHIGGDRCIDRVRNKLN